MERKEDVMSEFSKRMRRELRADRESERRERDRAKSGLRPYRKQSRQARAIDDVDYSGDTIADLKKAWGIY